jgi:hypothetical protein
MFGEFVAQSVRVRFYPPGEDWDFLLLFPLDCCLTHSQASQFAVC